MFIAALFITAKKLKQPMFINKISICLSIQWNIFQPYEGMKC